MEEIGEVSIVEDMRMTALARLYLDNIPHIKAYWPMFGKTTAQLALAFGADDMDGTIDEVFVKGGQTVKAGELLLTIK